jgi:hypothetical protein
MNTHEGKDLSRSEGFVALSVLAVGVILHMAGHFGFIERACVCLG